MLTLGLEEEFFVLYQGRPHMIGLTHLARLLRKDPHHYFTHSASNFTRGEGAKQGLMSALEVSTPVCTSAENVLHSLRLLRSQVASVIPTGLIAATGMFQRDDINNTAGLHIHLGVPVQDRERIYQNVAYFLPVLALATASSPFRGTEVFGPSYRMHGSYALGGITSDPYKRFQDLIITRRLGTIEVRVFDPVWDLERLEAIIRALVRVAELQDALPYRQEDYNRLRSQWTTQGLTPEMLQRARELHDTVGFDLKWVERTISDDLIELTAQQDYQHALRHLDSGYRTGTWQPSSTTDHPPAHHLSLEGWLTYYLPRFPYIAYKGIKENLKTSREK
ncbi:hypothetical protein [Deinococcus cellulosilyticus]|uniref:Glutamate--cysteine ligase n=1 Tax=Deinococcus cellulosilyticus (strain DSM 18568 / NBRC 106333 / KACC 11606 / 5516J-15) TaxID=1223518 RepID=A0A511NB69_DEIC1|nr:hypothetical protein [Deinococcus cellulosilyticus]GEM49806.1 hypothetical protein DC3_54410 [Deinococcus cellulosilyticus NBRC 106333 = KACC 11606]